MLEICNTFVAEHNLIFTICSAHSTDLRYGTLILRLANICTTGNKGVCTILKLHIRAHSYLLGPLLNQQIIHEQLYVKNIFLFFYTLCSFI